MACSIDCILSEFHPAKHRKIGTSHTIVLFLLVLSTRSGQRSKNLNVQCVVYGNKLPDAIWSKRITSLANADTKIERKESVFIISIQVYRMTICQWFYQALIKVGAFNKKCVIQGLHESKVLNHKWIFRKGASRQWFWFCLYVVWWWSRRRYHKLFTFCCWSVSFKYWLKMCLPFENSFCVMLMRMFSFNLLLF